MGDKRKLSTILNNTMMHDQFGNWTRNQQPLDHSPGAALTELHSLEREERQVG